MYFNNKYRTHNCGELRIKDIGRKVILSGWINKIRKFENFLFVDIRDYFGITQLIISKKIALNNLRREFLIKINGNVIKRKQKNYNLSTGDIEISVWKIEIINPSIPTPFNIVDKTDGKEIDRMKYRYLDIRRNPIKDNLIFKHNVLMKIRNFLSKNGFLEIETPILIKNTPEGAKNFLVPSRIYPKKFYALPQSPQLFKQLTIIGGIDKYFQIAKCFRDEDARSNRQIEFTQVDCEMSFVEKENVLNFFEKFLVYIFKKIKNINIKKPFPRISYNDSIKMYGTDCPDTRFSIKFINLKKLFNNKLNFFYLKKQKFISCIKTDIFDEKYFDNFIKDIKKSKKNFFWIKILNKENFFCSEKKILEKEFFSILLKKIKIKKNQFLFFSYGEKKEVINTLNLIKSNIIHKQTLTIKEKNIYSPTWIIDFPLLKWKKKEKKFRFFHHPFTNPKKEDLHFLKKNPEKVRSESYDLVINGVEIASGSIRINKKEIQKLMFNYLDISKKEIESNFGFFIKSFEYGTPPHGGIAFGLDRLIGILKGDINIKNFIAFPKNNYGEDLMINAPSKIK